MVSRKASWLLAQLSGAFAPAALLLACIGINGLVSYAVARRTAETGLRIASGAPPSSVVRIMVRDAIALVVAGLTIGFAALIPAARLIQAMLFGVTPADPVAIVSAAATMLGAALLAAYLPARRASRIDPMASFALRVDGSLLRRAGRRNATFRRLLECIPDLD